MGQRNINLENMYLAYPFHFGRRVWFDCHRHLCPKCCRGCAFLPPCNWSDLQVLAFASRTWKWNEAHQVKVSSSCKVVYADRCKIAPLCHAAINPKVHAYIKGSREPQPKMGHKSLKINNFPQLWSHFCHFGGQFSTHFLLRYRRESILFLNTLGLSVQ